MFDGKTLRNSKEIFKMLEYEYSSQFDIGQVQDLTLVVPPLANASTNEIPQNRSLPQLEWHLTATAGILKKSVLRGIR